MPNTLLTESEIFTAVIDAIKTLAQNDKTIDISDQPLSRETVLFDLNFDSLDTLWLLATLEDKYNLNLDSSYENISNLTTINTVIKTVQKALT